MGFGALFLLAFSGGLLELYRLSARTSSSPTTDRQERFLNIYLVSMAVLGWLSVLSGAYIVYPWYRAIPQVGADLSGYPQRLLLSSPSTAAWHNLGMEWKEHVSWFAAIAITMVAYVFVRYGRELADHRQLRKAVLAFAIASFLAAGIAGFFGAMINKHAPVQDVHKSPLGVGRTT
jgi:uncharacterized membrane protein